MDKKEYFDRCKEHDWYYQYAEGGTYYRGSANDEFLRKTAKENPELEAIYDAWYDHNFGKPERGPRPTYEMFGIAELKTA
ncbi:MAG: hypothetical protein HPY53_01585 [Brevinematales bacterium]|nr:hypothetical protein [Brevinematales bacterium]